LAEFAFKYINTMRFCYNEHIIHTLCFEIPIIIFFFWLILSNIAVIKIKYIEQERDFKEEKISHQELI